MSQEKVNARKEYKKNRKEILAREKRQSQLTKFIAYLCLICVIGGVGYSVYGKLAPQPEKDNTTFQSLIQTDEYGILDPSLPQ